LSTRSYTLNDPIPFRLSGDTKDPTIFWGLPTTHKIKNRWNALHAYVMRKAAESNPTDTPETNIEAMDRVSDELTDFMASRITKVENAWIDDTHHDEITDRAEIRRYIDGLLDDEHEDLVGILMSDQKIKALTFRAKRGPGAAPTPGEAKGDAA